MNLNSTFLRRTGRTQRMIEAAIKAATGKNELKKPQDVIIVTTPRDVRRMFRKMHKQLHETFPLGAFQSNFTENLIIFVCLRSTARIQILPIDHPGVDKNNFKVFGFQGLVYFDHFAIEWLYGHAIEKWLEFIKEDQQ